MPSSRGAELRCYMNLMALDSLPQSASGPRQGNFRERLDALGEAGFSGVQFATPATSEQLSDCRAVGFGFVGSGRINSPEEASLFAEHLAGEGYECATMLQDIWRSVRFVQRFPELRLNGDFSHWYTGQEMVYGGFEMKFQFIQPVFERVRFLHGRIGNPGCMQVRVEENAANEAPYLAHFKQLWTACFRSFLRTAAPGDY